MNESVDSAIRYIFVLSLILVIVAYFTGATGILKSIFGGANTLILSSTGRDSSGKFAGYPTGG